MTSVWRRPGCRVSQGHNVLLHGRDATQLADAAKILSGLPGAANATGRYFDNNAGWFGEPHPGAIDPRKSAELVRSIEAPLPDLKR